MNFTEDEISIIEEQQAKVLSIIRMVTSPISIIASLTLISMIARSNNRFSTTQSRLLAGLSIADIIFSLAMSLTSFPIPKGTPGTWMAMGNTATCEAQGFAILFGSMMAPLYNAALCIFYLLKIRYNYSDEVIKRKVEPLMHACPFLFTIFCVVYCLIADYFNPETGYCYIRDYPRSCSSANKKENYAKCERGNNVYHSFVFRLMTAIMFVVVPMVIFTSMWMLYAAAKKQDQAMARYGRGSLQGGAARNTSRNQQQSSNTRKTMFRGLAYAGAWFITFIFPAIAITNAILIRSPPYYLQILVAIFHPLQGFFNFLVYIYPKVLQAQTSDPSLSMFQAFKKALKPVGRGNDVRVQMPHQRQGNDSMAVRDVENVVDT